MATYTPEMDEHLLGVEGRVILLAKGLLGARLALAEVEAYLHAEAKLTPGLGLTRYECQGPACENLTDTPVRDDIAVSWIGDLAGTYCSPGCLSNAADVAAEQVAIERNYELVDRYYGWGRD